MASGMLDLASRLPRCRAFPRVAAITNLWLALAGCSRHGGEPRPEASASAQRPTNPLRIDDPIGYWPAHGFVEMVPPVEPPTRANRSNRVQVWLRIPDGALIDVAQDGDRTLLKYPTGTEAARAESIAEGDPSDPSSFRVRDVRGTRVEPGGRELFFVYRPAAQSGPALDGFEWHRDSSAEEKLAISGILDLLARVHVGPGLDKALRRVRTQNQCGLCHVHGRRDNVRAKELGVVNRGTDAGGFFLVPTVLASEAPLEAYEPRNPALESAYVSLGCESGTPAIDGTELRTASCSDGSVPRARLDVSRALANGDAHARSVCASRKYLLAHMAPSTRVAFAPAAAECGLGPGDTESALHR